MTTHPAPSEMVRMANELRRGSHSVMLPSAPATASTFSRTCRTFVTGAPCTNVRTGAVGFPVMSHLQHDMVRIGNTNKMLSSSQNLESMCCRAAVPPELTSGGGIGFWAMERAQEEAGAHVGLAVCAAAEQPDGLIELKRAQIDAVQDGASSFTQSPASDETPRCELPH